MGTRHLIAVAKNGEYRVAQFGLWDGHPEGQGFAILSFLKGDFDREKFLRNLDRASFITDAEYQKQEADCGATPQNGWVPVEAAQAFEKKYPELDRSAGAKILRLIQNAKEPLKLRRSLNFAADSRICKWAYVIDFDKNSLEVYSGSNEEPNPASDRFGYLCSSYRVKLFAAFDLNGLPTEEEFLNALKKDAS